MVWNKIRTLKGSKYQPLPNIMHYKSTELQSFSEIAHAYAESFQANSSNENGDDNFLQFKNKFEKNSHLTSILNLTNQNTIFPFI